MTHEPDEARPGKRTSEGNQCFLISRRYPELGKEQYGCKVQCDAHHLCIPHMRVRRQVMVDGKVNSVSYTLYRISPSNHAPRPLE